MIYATALRLFGPGISAIAKEFGLGEQVKLNDIRAVLYPTWRCDVLLQGKVMNEYSRERVESTGFIGVEGGYVPGKWEPLL